MKIKTINIENFRGIKNLTIDLNANLNVFVGINGVGKTTILDATAISLSWLINRIQRQNATGTHIADNDIRNETNYASIEIAIIEKNAQYKWKLNKGSKGTYRIDKSELYELSSLSNIFQESLASENTLPVIAYYPVNRLVNKTFPEIRGRDNLYILDAYENALVGRRNYESFFEWFRLQDDIVNEGATSRSKWMQQNEIWIKQRVNKILTEMKNTFIKNDKQFEDEEYKFFLNRFEKDELIYKEPRFLFHEISHLIEMIDRQSEDRWKYKHIFHDLEYMFHEMEYLSEYNDDLINEGGRHEEIIIKTIQDFKFIFSERKIDNNVGLFIWRTFVFANILSLWWMSEKGKRNIEQELLKFDFYKNQEKFDWENISNSLIETFKQVIKKEIKQKKNAHKSEGHELKIVTNAIEQFVPEYSSLRVTRVPRPHMLINKGEEVFNVDQLSDGEKNLITLVGDIARRLAIANPNYKNPLEGDGIILIDEIDLHLHPKWQRLMIPRLLKVFPNCQFLITTHSPQVLSHVKHDSLYLLKNKNNELSYLNATESYGMNTDRILEDLLDTDARPTEDKEKLHLLFKLIQDGKIDNAKKLIEEFEYKDDPELVKAKVLIKRKEFIFK